MFVIVVEQSGIYTALTWIFGEFLSGLNRCRRVLQGAPERAAGCDGLGQHNDPLAGPEGPAYICVGAHG